MRKIRAFFRSRYQGLVAQKRRPDLWLSELRPFQLVYRYACRYHGLAGGFTRPLGGCSSRVVFVKGSNLGLEQWFLTFFYHASLK